MLKPYDVITVLRGVTGTSKVLTATQLGRYNTYKVADLDDIDPKCAWLIVQQYSTGDLFTLHRPWTELELKPDGTSEEHVRCRKARDLDTEIAKCLTRLANRQY